MLAQFQAQYPTGSLISELLTIYQGKFVVRVSATIEGVTRSTGMAASETLELAEDQARSRALMVLLIGATTSAQLPVSAPQPAANQVQLQPVETAFSPEPMSQMKQGRPRTAESPSGGFLRSELSKTTAGLNAPAYSYGSQASPQEESTPAPAVSLKLQEHSSDRFPSIPTSAQEPEVSVESSGIMFDTQTESRTNPPISFGNVTPLTPPSYSPQESPTIEQTGITETAASEPLDLSDVIAKIDVELERVGWNPKHESEYLERIYGTRSRDLLTDEQLLDFLRYLELLAKTDLQIKRLKWTYQTGKDYLLRTYNKPKRTLLSYEELLDFLQYLELQPSP